MPTNGAHIAFGTAEALRITWNTKDVDSRLTPIEYLKNNLENLACERITITGHSLGGAITPVLATALADHSSHWNPSRRQISIDAYIFAGPTPGDEAFRTYTEKRVKINSIYNTTDIVPHAWQQNMLDEIPTLFDPWFGPITNGQHREIVHWTIQYIISLPQTPNTYKRWNNEKTFSGQLSPDDGYEIVKGINKSSKAVIKRLKKKSADQLCNITGVSKDQLDPYIIFFLKYFAVLGAQHVAQYQKHILNNPTFVTELKDALKSKSIISKLKAANEALEVLTTLFGKVSDFKRKNSQSRASTTS